METKRFGDDHAAGARSESWWKFVRQKLIGRMSTDVTAATGSLNSSHPESSPESGRQLSRGSLPRRVEYDNGPSLPGAYWCENSAMSDITDSHQSSTSQSPVALAGVATTHIPSRNEVLPTAVELERYSPRNNRWTQCLFVLMATTICALSIALGISLSTNSSHTVPTTAAVEMPPEAENPEDVFVQMSNNIKRDTINGFGSSVSLCRDGSRVAVAAGNGGLIQVFDLHDKQGWVQVGQNLTQETSFDWFKVVRTPIVFELSADCRVLAIGTPTAMVQQDNRKKHLRSAGQVELYRYDESQDSWKQLGDPNSITGEVDGQHAGAAISLSRDGAYVAVGYPGNGCKENEWKGLHVGMVKVFHLVSDSWCEVGPPLYGCLDHQRFGGSVSLTTLGDSPVVAVGSSTSATGNNRAASIFQLKHQRDAWVHRGTDIVPNTNSVRGTETTWSVQLSLDGSKLVISGRYMNNNGLAIRGGDAGLYVAAFELDSGAGGWVRMGKGIHRYEGGPKPGYAVSIAEAGTRIGIGDCRRLKCHIRLYELVDGQWCQLGPNIEGDASGNIACSLSLSGDGKRIALGYPKRCVHGGKHGLVRVFDIHDEGVVSNCEHAPGLLL